MADDLSGPNPTQQALSQARLNEAKQQNAQTTANRQVAPGAIRSGSPEEAQVRAQAAQDLQQAQFNSNYRSTSLEQKSSSPDQFAAQREAALKTGSFDYSAVRSASYSPPSTFVNTKGERMIRTPVPPSPVSQPRIQTIANQSPINTGGGPPVIQFSQSQLQRTNALRASQGLPPIEKVASIQVVKGTQSQPIPKTKEPDIRTQYEKALATLSTQNKGGEAVSFLRFPFTQNKGESSGGIQSTTIIDPLQFLIGGAVGTAKAGVSFLTGLIKSEGKTLVKEGAKDIGLNVKSSKEFLEAQRFTQQTKLLPKPDSIKPTSSATVKPKPSGPIFSSQEVNLGKGQVQSDLAYIYINPPKEKFFATFQSLGSGPAKVRTLPTPESMIKSSKLSEIKVSLGTGQGKIVSKGGSGGITGKVTPKTPPATTSPPSTGGKEVSVGKGIVQVIRQEQVIKPVSKIKVDYVKLGEGKGKLVQIQKPKLVPPKTIQKTTQEIKVTPELKTTTIQEPRIKQKQRQGLVIPVLPRTKETFRQPQKIRTRVPAVLIPPAEKQRQSQTTRLLNPPITTTTLINPPRLPPPKSPPPIIRTPPKPPRTPTTEVEPPKRPPPYTGLLGTKSGALSRVSKSGSRLGYVGNVPLSEIVGIYNRPEATYGSVKASRITRKDYAKEQKLSSNTHKSLIGQNKNIQI